MHVLAVVLGAERRKDEVSVRQDLAQAGYLADGRPIAADPDHFGRGVSGGATLDDGARRVGEVDPVGGFLQEDRPLGVVHLGGGVGAFFVRVVGRKGVEKMF